MTRRLTATAVLAALLSACASTGSSPQALQDFSARQSAAAQQAMDEGRLLEALSLWQTVATVAPANSDVSARIAQLKEQIAIETRSAVSNGEAAYARGSATEGDRWMLRALALTPGQPAALKALRLSVSEASHNRQKEKVESAYAGLEEEPQPPEPVAPEPELATLAPLLAQLQLAGDYEGVLTAADASTRTLNASELAWVRKAHIALAERSGNAGKPELQLVHLDKALAIASVPGEQLQQERQRLAEMLSDSYYRESLTLFKEDLDAAIAALRRSITYNPANIAAVEKLDQAQTLKRNLQRIQGG